MKTAHEWTDEFLNTHVLNVRGNEFETFVKSIQNDVLGTLPPTTEVFTVNYIDSDDNRGG